jgi:hypothetical protein
MAPSLAWSIDVVATMTDWAAGHFIVGRGHSNCAIIAEMRYARIVGPAFFFLAVAAGALVALAPVAWPGLEFYGSACGGGGEAQVCRELTRRLTLVEVGWHAWLWVAGGLVCAAIALAALLVPIEDWRLLAAIAVFGLAVAGLVTATQVQVLVRDPDGSTVGREDHEWGPYLAPALLDFRADGLRRYEGHRERQGVPAYEREQILDSFAVHPLRGWHVFYTTIVVMLFLSLFEVARRSLQRPSLALVIALTGGAVIWAVIADESVPRLEGTSESYEGLLTALTVIAAAAAWAAYGVAVAVGRLVLPRLSRLLQRQR